MFLPVLLLFAILSFKYGTDVYLVVNGYLDKMVFIPAGSVPRLLSCFCFFIAKALTKSQVSYLLKQIK